MDKVDRFLTKRQVKDITTLSFAEIDRREIRGASLRANEDETQTSREFRP